MNVTTASTKTRTYAQAAALKLKSLSLNPNDQHHLYWAFSSGEISDNEYVAALDCLKSGKISTLIYVKL